MIEGAPLSMRPIRRQLMSLYADSALRFAILGDPARSAERKQIIELLLEHGADINNTVNHAPATPILMVRTADILQVFLDHGAEVKTNVPHGGLPEAVACNRDVKDPVSMFTVLLARGVRLTTSEQASPNVLQCAVMTHHPELETFLLAHGVPADLRDVNGRTALFGALDQATMDPLLRHGADINATDAKHATPLSDAIAQGRQLQAQLLLALGAKGQGTANMALIASAESLAVLPKYRLVRRLANNRILGRSV
jgi:ankyrin repeat protein